MRLANSADLAVIDRKHNELRIESKHKIESCTIASLIGNEGGKSQIDVTVADNTDSPPPCRAPYS